MVVSVIALSAALAGTAVAGIPKGDPLKLGMFQDSSRDRLAGTGVIQYAAATQTTAATNGLQQFAVQCAAAKKATAGGWKWNNYPPPPSASYDFIGAYPTGGGFKVMLDIKAALAHNQPLSVFANCVKSRKQDGTPPS